MWIEVWPTNSHCAFLWRVSRTQHAVIVPGWKLISNSQFFWGTVINKAGAGPPPQPYELLTSQKLASAIKTCLSPEVMEAALDLSRRMATEDGVNAVVESFYRHLPLKKMTCNFFPDQTAVWAYGRGQRTVQMCQAVATVLRDHGKTTGQDLRLYVL